VGNQIGDRAVVLGGSIAGMLAARTLSESYREVLVVDRDELSGPLGPRRAVPQGGHIHALLARGQQILDELFPGLTDELVSFGASIGDFSANLRWYFNGRKLKQVESGLICVGAGRALLEDRIRARIRGLSNVTILERTDIVGLVASPDQRRIIGARVQSQAEGSVEEILEADLVMDTTGRGSRLSRWLEELGYPKVEEERVKMNLTYTSADFRIAKADDQLGDDIASIPVATPEMPRGAIYGRMPDRHSVSLTGILGERPPVEREGFLAYVRSLPAPEIYEALRDAEPMGDPITFHFPASLRRRYERLGRFPDGLLVMGDAASMFNPVYGQGMTVASIEAMILRDHLREGTEPKPARFLRDIARAINGPWDIAAGGDLSFPAVEGKRSLKVRMGNLYIPRLQAAAEYDGVLATAFLRSAGLVAPPTALLAPAMVLRVLRSKKPSQAVIPAQPTATTQPTPATQPTATAPAVAPGPGPLGGESAAVGSDRLAG
jgi:2-polyprenyl-6-methoxyphenol hydroxylase-like FAD-dependent oxidoreductase